MTQAKIKAKNLNLRAKPDPKGAILGSLAQGTQVDILEDAGDWVKVSATGFLHRKYLEILSDYPSPGTDVEDDGGAGRGNPTKYLWQNSKLQTLALAPAKKMKVSGSARQKKLIGVFNEYGGLLSAVSKMLKVKLAASLAVICVESGGVAFKNDKMVIRFEPHWFWKLWGEKNTGSRPNKTLFDEHFSFESWHGETHYYRASAFGEWKSFHGSQAREWEAFEMARGLDEVAALKSISMGLGQVMGFNHARIGYDSMTAMFVNFSRDARFHVLGIFDFMDSAMVKALAGGDYVAFARGYNGSGQAKSYGELIKGFVGEWEKI